MCQRIKKTIRNLLKKQDFLKRNAGYLTELPSVIKQNNNTVTSSTKMTSLQASMKKNERIVFNNLQHRRKNINLNFNWLSYFEMLIL